MKSLLGKIPTVVYENGEFIVKWIKEKKNDEVQKQKNSRRLSEPVRESDK